jgi:hypothetical protein
MRRLRSCAFLLGLFGCAHNVPQDRATGPDGKLKGAKPLALVDGEGRDRDIVTYPGGDRVDWKQIELPANSHGKLDLQLTWKTPRPGLQVAFDVFDQWNHPIVATKAVGHTRGRTRSATIMDARGTYFVRVYAPKRGDAGAYTLSASFVEEKQSTIDPLTIPIPDPPRLAAVPPPKATCDTFDPRNEACQTECPFDAPVGWKGCRDRDDKEKADADAKVQAAARQACLANLPKPTTARIIHVEISGKQTSIRLNKGTTEEKLLDTGWTAVVLSSGTGKPMAEGKVKLVRVATDQTLGVSSLTTDQLTANPMVQLTPPAGQCP